MTSDQKRLRRPDIVLIVMQHDHDYERGINDADKVGQPQPLFAMSLAYCNRRQILSATARDRLSCLKSDSNR